MTTVAIIISVLSLVLSVSSLIFVEYVIAKNRKMIKETRDKITSYNFRELKPKKPGE